MKVVLLTDLFSGWHMVSDFSTKAAVEKYLPLMHELATRIDLVANAFDGSLRLTPPYAREYAFLQFRRICELIALGSLQLHGYLPVASNGSAQKQWNADKLINLLVRHHSDAFPRSVTRDRTSEGWNISLDSKPNALTLAEFKKLYAECGHVLHRGTIRTLESSRDFSKEDYQNAAKWHLKLIDLMTEHAVSRSGGEGMYMVSLRTESGTPECSIFDFTANGELKVHTTNIAISEDVVDSYIAPAIL